MESNISDGSIDARACQNTSADGSLGGVLDTSPAFPRPYIPKTIDLRLRGTPAQVATLVKKLSNRLLRELGYLPFAFDPTTNFRKPTITTGFDSDRTEIPDIIVYPMEFGRPFDPQEPLRLPETGLGRIELHVRPRDRDGDYTDLHFSCNELDWPAHKGRVDQLLMEFGRHGFLDDTTGETVKEALAAEAPEFDFAELAALLEELRAGRGRKHAPLNFRVAVVLGAIEAERRGQSQSLYCAFITSPRDPQTHLAVSTLREWQKDREVIVWIGKTMKSISTPQFQELCKKCYTEVIEKPSKKTR